MFNLGLYFRTLDLTKTNVFLKLGLKKFCDSASNDQGYQLVGSKDEQSDKYSVLEISPGPYPHTIR